MDDDSNGTLYPCGAQIDDVPSCLIMDILLRLPTTSLLSCRVVCKSWYLIFSDPLFVKLHHARSPTYLIGHRIAPMQFVSRYCINLVPGETPESVANCRVHHSDLTCLHSSSNGLLCFENRESGDEIYVCNPVLGEYITIPTRNTYTETVDCVMYALGFSVRSNQFKVLQINSPNNIVPYLARIYTIGDGTRQWKSIGIAPSCRSFMGYCFLNGSVHWADEETLEIFYFNFDSEQFGSLPSPPVPVARDGGRRYAIMGVLDGCLFFYAMRKMQFWIMKEYGVEESWTKIFSIDSSEKLSLLYGTTYNPSFFSLQDVAKGEQFTLIS